MNGKEWLVMSLVYVGLLITVVAAAWMDKR